MSLENDVARGNLALEAWREIEQTAILGGMEDFDGPFRPEDGGEVEN